ncbi:transcriptional regulator with XRE-family HTH domain [Actinoalloteichus hoggarensis]|uniref:Helix-turn-helix protein n=1 Tax=Actinoalloteichus hoggarensis TaxID=1470176 RepID=A0A221W1B3_9PSEU|nr:helix-turn-helix transcriptional regulator [Actinoalloteichus hoggarensis]ASO19520.1 helix-turn-helix protein [Actinoalloteichus hoggarensis]MBB5919773.1 transcriptional regulator with XRE-family HTH domain [Actinoalloteichus hoggarensis]
MAGTHRSPRALALAAALREARAATGLTQRGLAERIGAPHSRITRYESGSRVPKENEVATILGALGTEPVLRTHILEIARDVDRETWSEVTQMGTPTQLDTLTQYERSATALTDISTVLIPGLLQTPGYARTIMSSAQDAIPAGDVERRVLYRLGRQRILDGPSAPQFTAVIDETALIRRVGGAAVMAEQLDHIAWMTTKPNVSVRIVGLDVSYHHAMVAGWFVIEFADAAPVVQLEHFNTGTFVHARATTRSFLDARDSVLSVAMSPEESTQLIATHAEHHRRGDELYDRT